MKPILGKSDYFDFSELQLTEVPCKIDSGAYMSVIHCTDATVTDGELEFKFGKHSAFKFPEKTYKTPKYTVKEITSSNGESEKRYTISTAIKIFGKEYETIFTLTDRLSMNSPVLIGRLALASFLIDVTKKNQSFESKYRED